MAVDFGLQIKATDINNLSFFPVGMVLPISGTVVSASGGVTVNGQFLNGWHICDGQNGTPNLLNRFIAGTDSACGNAGASSVTLTEEHLPPHTHTITVNSVGSGGSHSHAITGDKYDDCNYTGVNSPNSVARGTSSSNAYGAGEGWSYRWYYPIFTDNSISSHSHSISGSIGTTSENSTLNLLPAYYTLIFIRKCT